MRRALLVLALVIAGCGGDGDSTGSSDEGLPADFGPPTGAAVSPCETAMSQAAAEVDPEAADPLIVATLSACSGVDEWLAALRSFPAALGVSGPEHVGTLDVQAACAGGDAVASTPVCMDAAARGLLG